MRGCHGVVMYFVHMYWGMVVRWRMYVWCSVRGRARYDGVSVYITFRGENISELAVRLNPISSKCQY